jgi:regulator of nucleoside diphosphate kinase
MESVMLFLPAVRIPRQDWDRLMQLAFDARHNLHPAAPLLRAEVHRAIVTRDRTDEVVQLNGAVRYRFDERAPVDRVLVHPDDQGTSELNLSVLTSLGAALIGNRVGDSMPFLCADGTLHQVTPLACKAV